jgi:hypothetical protein
LDAHDSAGYCCAMVSGVARSRNAVTSVTCVAPIQCIVHWNDPLLLYASDERSNHWNAVLGGCLAQMAFQWAKRAAVWHGTTLGYSRAARRLKKQRNGHTAVRQRQRRFPVRVFNCSALFKTKTSARLAASQSEREC